MNNEESKLINQAESESTKVNPNKYLKTNPYILGNLWSNKKFNNYYKIFKYSLSLFAATISLLSLWFITLWESNAFANLGLSTVTYNGITVNLGPSDAKNVFFTYGIHQWKNSIVTSAHFSSLLALSFISLFFMLFTLVFKNGTLMSVIFISTLFVLSITIASIFFICFTDNTLTEAINSYKKFNIDLNTAVSNNATQEQLQQMVTDFNTKLGSLLGY